MSYFFRVALLNEYKVNFPKVTYWVHLLLTSLLTLWVYRLTSNALQSNLNSDLNWYGLSYFDFLIAGELGLTLQLSLLDATTRAIRVSHFSGFLDYLLFQSKFTHRSLVGLAVSSCTREIAQWLMTLSLSVIVFDFNVSIFKITIVFLMIVISSSFFLFLGQIFGAIVLLTGRGAGLISQFLFLISVLSGVYFPLEVLPQGLRDNIFNYIPTTYALHKIRLVFSGGANMPMLVEYTTYFILSAAILYPLSKIFLNFAIKYKTQNSTWAMPVR